MKTIFYKLILCLALFITLFFLYKPQINNKIYKGKEKDVINSSDVATTIMPIAQALVAVAAGVLVVVTCIMGVKYATATSPDTQAKLKKQLIGLVVSIVVVFGAHAIWTIVYNFMKDF